MNDFSLNLRFAVQYLPIFILYFVLRRIKVILDNSLHDQEVGWNGHKPSYTSFPSLLITDRMSTHGLCSRK